MPAWLRSMHDVVCRSVHFLLLDTLLVFGTAICHGGSGTKAQKPARAEPRFTPVRRSSPSPLPSCKCSPSPWSGLLFAQLLSCSRLFVPSQHNSSEKLSHCELLAVDEAAAIPLPLVKKLLGPYLVFLSSTVNGYEGTGRALSLKLIDQLRKQQGLYLGRGRCCGRRED